MKYIVTYESGTTGFGWQHECETVEQVKWLTDDIRRGRSAYISVLDTTSGEYIYLKNCFESRPKVDFIYSSAENKLKKVLQNTLQIPKSLL